MKNDEMIMTVEECASVLGSNPRHIREAIENGTFPFGICFKTNKSRVYKISRTAFNRWLKGESVEVS